MAKTKPNPDEQRPNPGDLAAFAKATDIDRRQCKRVVPLKVLALGLSRSGTCSLRQALIDLGYTDCYHYTTPLQENPRDQEMWAEAFEAKFKGQGKLYTKKEWDQLLGHCQAITDTPCVLFYKELLEAYPDAKVILTVRDNPDVWFKSQMSTIVPYIEKVCNPDAGILDRFYRLFGPLDGRFFRFTNGQTRSPMFKMLLEDYRNGTENAKQWYLDYNEEIKRIVPKENLLVMNVKEGWEPLCKFLDKEVPLYPFPRKNDTNTFQHHTGVFADLMNTVIKWNILKTTGAALALTTAVALGAHRYGLLQHLRMR